MTLQKGDKVKVEYTGTLDDGSVFDTTDKDEQPLEFEIGAGQIIPGFEETITEMQEGEEKEVQLSPDKAYGDHKEELYREIPKDKFPQDQELKEGMAIAMSLPDGQQVPGKVIELGEDNVKVDFNHPLAGKNLNFKVKLVSINSEGEESNTEESSEESQ